MAASPPLAEEAMRQGRKAAARQSVGRRKIAFSISDLVGARNKLIDARTVRLRSKMIPLDIMYRYIYFISTRTIYIFILVRFIYNRTYADEYNHKSGASIS